MRLKELEKLEKISKKVYNKNKKLIFDIVLFGSSVKGKFRPKDIDISVLLNRPVSQEDIKKILTEFGKDYHTEYLFLTDLYKESLWISLMHEGYSLLKKKFLYEIFGLKSCVIFSYDLKKLSSVEKSRFSHALFGRKDRNGILHEARGKVLGKGSILVPIENSEKIRETLESWGINYSVKNVFVW